MIAINVFDSTFVGQLCSVALQAPAKLRYAHKRLRWEGVTTFVDGWIYDPVVPDVESTFKVAWLHEARSLHPENYDRIDQVIERFDVVMTHDAQLLARGAPFVKTIRGGSWVRPQHWGMPAKTKHVAMILSDKTTLPGHQLRHAIASAGLPIDLFGARGQPIGHDKALAYRDYRYAVVVEACQEQNFFSEHLLDAIALGCVPLYWGCPNIASYFNMAGFWTFRDVRDLAELLPLCTPETYAAARAVIQIDQGRARDYAITEDWQADHIYTPLLEGVALW